MTRNWFTCVVKYVRHGADGSEEKTTDQLLLDAYTYTEAEARLVGIVTDGDLRRHLDGLLEKRVCDVMTRNPKTITAGRLAAEAVALMNGNNITALVVTDGETGTRAQGILRIHDCMRAGLV